jgi:hypothetical protein
VKRIRVFGLGVLIIVSGCMANAQRTAHDLRGGAHKQFGINQSCASGAVRGSDLNVHGRLAVYNGGSPNLRLWHIGTHHLFGIYGDPADLSCIRGGVCDGDEDTKLPSNLDALMKLPNTLFEYEIYGDFKIRFLELFRPGHMQAACIVDARNLVRRRTHR